MNLKGSKVFVGFVGSSASVDAPEVFDCGRFVDMSTYELVPTEESERRERAE